MTMPSATSPRTVSIGGRREVLVAGLVAAAMIVAALALRLDHGAAADHQAERGWVGHLASAASAEPAVEPPLRSSSYVVPSADLALPAVARRPPQLKATCESADRDCAVRAIVPAPGPKRQALSSDLAPSSRSAPNRGGDAKVAKGATKPKVFSMNPLDHLPDMATVGRPFMAAGATVSGWIRRL